MGHSHALSGLAVGAATLPWAPVAGAVPQVAWVAAVGGFAMLPDLDQAGSTAGRMWGPISDIPAGLVGRVARGHRWGTHDAVLGAGAFGLLAFLAARTTWSTLTLLAVAIGLALHALNFVIPGRLENTIIGNLVLSWGGAWLLMTHVPGQLWLPYAVIVGCWTHIAGDLLTCEGVPVPLVWVVHRCRVKVTPLRTGTSIERLVLAPAFLLTALVFLYLNTGVQRALDPLVQRVAHLG